jgi:Flp pilus assembly protein TadD
MNRRAVFKPAAGLAATAVFCWWPMNPPLLTDLERNLAYAYEQNGQFGEAIAIYERLKKMERNPENELYLANALGLAKRSDEAFAILARLSAPQQPAALRQRAFNFRGDLARRNKQWEEAEQAYRAALSIDSSDYGAWNNLGVALINRKRFSDAETALTESIRLAPEDALARTNLDALRRYLAQQGGAVSAGERRTAPVSP